MSDIEIELGGETVSLRCTLGAFKDVSGQFGGFVRAFQKLAEVDIDAIAYIIAAGIGKHKNSRERERIVEKLFEGGLDEVLPKVTEYLGLLSGGGKKREEAQSDAEGER